MNRRQPFQSYVMLYDLTDSGGRLLTIAEAIVGQLYPATLISALVAMAMQSRRKP